MATKTGSSYTTGTTADSVEIPTAIPGFSTTANPNKVSPSDCDNDRQPEINYNIDVLTVLFTVSEIYEFPVSAALSDCRSLLESPRYTSCEFAMIECRRFIVGMLMVYVTVSKISVLPVNWLPS